MLSPFFLCLWLRLWFLRQEVLRPSCLPLMWKRRQRRGFMCVLFLWRFPFNDYLNLLYHFVLDGTKLGAKLMYRM